MTVLRANLCETSWELRRLAIYCFDSLFDREIRVKQLWSLQHRSQGWSWWLFLGTSWDGLRNSISSPKVPSTCVTSELSPCMFVRLTSIAESIEQMHIMMISLKKMVNLYILENNDCLHFENDGQFLWPPKWASRPNLLSPLSTYRASSQRLSQSAEWILTSCQTADRCISWSEHFPGQSQNRWRSQKSIFQICYFQPFFYGTVLEFKVTERRYRPNWESHCLGTTKEFGLDRQEKDASQIISSAEENSRHQPPMLSTTRSILWVRDNNERDSSKEECTLWSFQRVQNEKRRRRCS